MFSDQDGAEPSANGVALSNLRTLGALLGSEEYVQRAKQLTAAFAHRFPGVLVRSPSRKRIFFC